MFLFIILTFKFTTIQAHQSMHRLQTVYSDFII